VGASRDEVEKSFVRILAMLEPTQELLNRLAKSPRPIGLTGWSASLLSASSFLFGLQTRRL